MGDGSWLAHFGILALLAVVPFVVVVCTSFAKVVIVLGIVKNALGAQTVIPGTVITALAMVVTLFIMGPVLDEMMDVPMPQAASTGDASEGNRALFEDAQKFYAALSPPLIHFLKQNTPKKELDFYSGLDNSADKNASTVRVLLLAFASAELIEAFMLGILVLVPFLVVDLIVANTLAALGFVSIPAMALALPFKLLLFVAADGWHLLVNALIISYGIT
ncbi:MAG: EscR/YscR/HrcR family type III secretion system export apparatus protein [Deltaproteobacteria bacterium]|nr:EscR/YscR/HrcR family type III secretion system export apparatus protein [Deltaproteobacteria bacterium]